MGLFAVVLISLGVFTLGDAAGVAASGSDANMAILNSCSAFVASIEAKLKPYEPYAPRLDANAICGALQSMYRLIVEYAFPGEESRVVDPALDDAKKKLCAELAKAAAQGGMVGMAAGIARSMAGCN